MDVRFRLFDQQEIGDREFFALVLELQQLQRQVDQVGPAQAQLVYRSLIAFLGLAHKQTQRLK
ncbi:hypothetical protein D3C86_2132740 [compost metagenome]